MQIIYFACLDRQWHRWHITQFFVANVNVNSDGLNVNVNRFENDNVWNAKYAHRMVVPKMDGSPLYTGGVLLSKPFFHPPSILPISSSCAERVVYFSFGRHLFSHANCRKNFTPSSFDIETVIRLILGFPDRYRETKIFSSISKKYESILPPRL